MVFMTKEKIKDILMRAGKTFAQAFIGSFSIDIFIGVTDSNALKKLALAALVGAVAAGVSAVWNTLVDWAIRKIDTMMPTSDELTKAIEGADENE
jgi:hypothetical protein